MWFLLKGVLIKYLEVLIQLSDILVAVVILVPDIFISKTSYPATDYWSSNFQDSCEKKNYDLVFFSLEFHTPYNRVIWWNVKLGANVSDLLWPLFDWSNLSKTKPTFLLYDRSANSMWGGEVTEEMSKISQHRNIGTIKTFSKVTTLYIMKIYSILITYMMI